MVKLTKMSINALKDEFEVRLKRCFLCLSKFLISIISLCLSIQIYSQSPDTAKLNQAYRNLIAGKQDSELMFFKAFPSTFMQFYKTYHDGGYAPDIHLVAQHLTAFESVATRVPIDIYCGKLITLSIAGKWDADAVSGLQDIIHRWTEHNLKPMLAGLNKHSKGYQLRFWQFYWSSIAAHTHLYEKYKKLKILIKQISPKQAEIMDLGFEYAWKEMEFPDVIF